MREREKEGERERCRIWSLNLIFNKMAALLFLFLMGMTGALAPFSFLVEKIV